MCVFERRSCRAWGNKMRVFALLYMELDFMFNQELQELQELSEDYDEREVQADFV